MLQFKQTKENDILILEIIGEIDASSSIELDLTIAKIVDLGATKILIDCSSLEYISSAGLGVFMSYIEEFKEKKLIMILFGMKKKVFHTFEILGLSKILNICETNEEAKKTLNELSI